ncbi:MAG: hypothetical protein LBO74_08215 [Candidatus Symbiothrix sp.]|nr:hypothetical protein [Candidatus Symbiothrix sp.]
MKRIVKKECYKTLASAIQQAFTENLKKSYSLVFTDYKDTYEDAPEIIQQCMDENSAEPLYDNLWDAEARYEGSLYELQSLTDEILANKKYSPIHDYLDDWLEDNREQILQYIEERDDSDPIAEMLSRTRLRGRATLYTNYDCFPSNYAMGNTYCYAEYFKDMIDVLYLNPALVKKTFNEHGIDTIGRWPNLSYRNRKEAVLYKAFANEMLNQCCFGLLTFMGMLPLTDLYHSGFQKHKKIVVPKGNFCGMFNSWNGGGSLMNMELQRDLIIPTIFPQKTKYDNCSACVDESRCNNGYCINEVYGMVRSTWRNNFTFIE